MAEARLLYGEPILEAMATGDRELMEAMSKVSTHLLSRSSGNDQALEDWKAADAKLKAALE